jgi:3-oxoacyl-[acyl-carrier-protein] synthase II
MSKVMERQDRRVVITGIGLATPLGCGTEKNWQALIAGRSGIGPLTLFDCSDFPVRFAGQVNDFDPAAFIDKKEIKRADRFAQFALAAAQMAMDDSGYVIERDLAHRVGVVIGVGMGGISTVEDYHREFLKSGLKRVSPFLIPRLIANLAPAQIAIRFGCTGVNYTPTSACASGGHAVGEAYRQVRFGYQDMIIAGGAEAALTPMGVGGFAVMKALSTRNEDPQRASRPFDLQRDGFVMAEGAGIVILEELRHAQSRGARIIAEVAGYGANSDAYHITTPAPEGRGAKECMRLALADGEIDPVEVDYINAHGTSTQYNDTNETEAIRRVFGERAYKLPVSSTKSMTGHMLGAAGGVEAAFTALAIYHRCIPPTINYEFPDPACDLDYVPNHARPAEIRVALSNSFGFGGTNSCVAFRRWSSETR